MNMQSCAELCAKCHQTCLQTAMTHCLTMGGDHVKPEHFKLMINCSQICQTSSDLQLTGSAFSKAYCALCAEVCEACAESCDELDNMKECAQVCRECAKSCREMAIH